VTLKNKKLTVSHARKSSKAKGSDWEDRQRLRDQFLGQDINIRRLLESFDHISGLQYFIKDTKSRTMATSRSTFNRLGIRDEKGVIGKAADSYLPRDLAEKYMEDDRKVIETGKPLRNIVEMYMNENGIRDWIITDKFPLYNSKGKIVGLIGTIQSFEARRKVLAHLGPVGKAADYIRENLGEPLMLTDVARLAGFSERQLQRLFHRVFGMTIQKFIIHSRIHRAIYDLIHSDLSLSEISSLYGFGDQSAFSNKFREVTGLTPRGYRLRYLADIIKPSLSSDRNS
jgi:AraC-like DNA-binding protein